MSDELVDLYNRISNEGEIPLYSLSEESRDIANRLISLDKIEKEESEKFGLVLVKAKKRSLFGR